MKFFVELALAAFCTTGAVWFVHDTQVKTRDEARRDQWQSAVVEKCHPPQLRRPGGTR